MEAGPEAAWVLVAKAITAQPTNVMDDKKCLRREMENMGTFLLLLRLSYGD